MAPKTVKELAAARGLSRQLLYVWCNEKRLPHYRAGGKGRRGRILIDPADLDALLESIRVPAGPPGDDGEFRHSRRASGSPG